MMEKPRTLDEIIDFCREIQARFSPSRHLREEGGQYRKALIELCRRCGDSSCPEDCEVKKAYLAESEVVARSDFVRPGVFLRHGESMMNRVNRIVKRIVNRAGES